MIFTNDTYGLYNEYAHTCTLFEFIIGNGFVSEFIGPSYNFTCKVSKLKRLRN